MRRVDCTMYACLKMSIDGTQLSMECSWTYLWEDSVDNSSDRDSFVNLNFSLTQGASSSVSDVDHYVITKKLLDPIFSILPMFICQWGFQAYWVNTFLIRWQWVCVNDNIKALWNMCICVQCYEVGLICCIPFIGNYFITVFWIQHIFNMLQYWSSLVSFKNFAWLKASQFMENCKFYYRILLPDNGTPFFVRHSRWRVISWMSS
jgi:hypothetical protein